MKSSPVTDGLTGRIEQFNDLREDARASSYLLAHQKASPNLTLEVEEGNVYFGGELAVFPGGDSPTFTAPSANPRIDILSMLKRYADEPGTVSNTTQNTDAQINNTATIGQTFTTPVGTAYKLRSVAFRMYRGSFDGNSASSSFALHIYATDGSGLPTGSSLGSVTGNLGGMSGSAGDNFTMTFGSPVSLSNNTKYALVLTFTFAASGTNYWVKYYYQNTNIYSGGDRLTNSTTKDTGADLYFIATHFLSAEPTLVRTAGTESASPVAPAIPADSFMICQVYNKVGQTSIRDVDTSGQGYILKDIRAFLKKSTVQFVEGSSAEFSTDAGEVVMIIGAMKGATATHELVIDGVSKTSSNYGGGSGVTLTWVQAYTAGQHTVVMNGVSANPTLLIIKL